MTTDFLDYSKNILIEKLGNTGEDLFIRVLAKKPINEKSSKTELTDFIKTIENIVPIVSDGKKAEEICDLLRNKLNEAPKTIIHELKEKPDDVSIEIESFLKKYNLPTDSDIKDFAKYMEIKYGGKSKKIETEIIQKIKAQLQDSINRDKIRQEINEFLNRFQQPSKEDIDDFVCYLQIQKLPFGEDELREQIEKERLYQKFQGTEDDAVESGIDQLVNFIKNGDQEDIQNVIKHKKISYLIKDEADMSDNSLMEFKELIKPNEKDMKDTLEGIGLKHMIMK